MDQRLDRIRGEGTLAGYDPGWIENAGLVESFQEVDSASRSVPTGEGMDFVTVTISIGSHYPDSTTLRIHDIVGRA